MVPDQTDSTGQGYMPLFMEEEDFRDIDDSDSESDDDDYTINIEVMHDTRKDYEHGYGRTLKLTNSPVQPIAPPISTRSEYEDVTMTEGTYDTLVTGSTPVKDRAPPVHMYNKLPRSAVVKEQRREKSKSMVYQDTDGSFRIKVKTAVHKFTQPTMCDVPSSYTLYICCFITFIMSKLLNRQSLVIFQIVYMTFYFVKHGMLHFILNLNY